MKATWILMIVALGLCASGCRFNAKATVGLPRPGHLHVGHHKPGLHVKPGHLHIGHHHHRTARPVTVTIGHRHDHYCGHYHYRGVWYVHEGHRHGDGCGHSYDGGVWVLRD